MKFWILKGHKKSWYSPKKPPSDEQFFESNFFTDGHIEDWHTDKPIPKGFAEGDGAFIWLSAPKRKVIAIGEIGGIGQREVKTTRFDVINIGTYFKNQIGIDLLRTIPVFESASFLKPGAAGTIFPLTDEQAAELVRLIEVANLSIGLPWFKNSSDVATAAPELTSQARRNTKRREALALKAIDPILREGSLPREVKQFHNELQNKLSQILQEQYPDGTVSLEENYVDVSLRESNGKLTFFEVKPYSDPIFCIRESLGQLLYYSFMEAPDKLVAAGPSLIDEESQEFLKYIRSKINIEIEYLHVELI